MYTKRNRDPALSTLKIMAAQMADLNEKMEAAIDLLQTSIDSVINLGAEIKFDQEQQAQPPKNEYPDGFIGW